MISPNLPPPDGVDFSSIGGWLAGVAGIATAIWLAVNQALRRGKEIVETPPTHQTRVITTDSVALDQHAASLEANTMAMTENSALMRELLGEFRGYLKDLHEDKVEAEIIEKIRLKLERDEKARLRGPRNRVDRSPEG